MKWRSYRLSVEDEMNDFQLKYEPLNPKDVFAAQQDVALGAHVQFIGTVRNFSKEKKVIALEFEAYEAMVFVELDRIANEIFGRWPVQHISLHHRLGKVEVGELPVIAAIAAKHRNEAFAACAYLMNRLKQSVPIWKKEIFDDGSEWVTPNP